MSTGYGDALNRLRDAQKSSKGAPLYSLLVNRPLGRVAAAAAFQAGLTPNQVTVISALFTYASIAVLAAAPVSILTGLVVAAGLVIGYALDAADGQLARLRGGGSVAGEWLDHVIDAGKIASLHLAVLITLYLHTDLPRALLLVPIGFSVVATVHFFGMLLSEQLSLVKRARAGLGPVPKGSSPRWLSAAKLPTDYGVLCLVFVLLGVPLVFVSVYGLLGLATLGYLLLVLRKWYREMKALDSDIPAPVRVGSR